MDGSLAAAAGRDEAGTRVKSPTRVGLRTVQAYIRLRLTLRRTRTLAYAYAEA